VELCNIEPSPPTELPTGIVTHLLNVTVPPLCDGDCYANDCPRRVNNIWSISGWNKDCRASILQGFTQRPTILGLRLGWSCSRWRRSSRAPRRIRRQDDSRTPHSVMNLAEPPVQPDTRPVKLCNMFLSYSRRFLFIYLGLYRLLPLCRISRSRFRLLVLHL
jgi:hypothetical protein